jgi:hypothetical protein
MPGLGSRPSEYSTAISHCLDHTGDDNNTMGRGAVWHKMIEALAGRSKIVIYVPSVADGSGSDNGCQASDRSIAVNSPTVNSWSATRWVSYNADRFGFRKNGENPGQVDTNRYGKQMLTVSTQQARSYGFQGFMWAYDANLFDGRSGVTLADMAAVIRQNS